MAKNKLKLEFDGFDKIIKQLEDLDGDVNKTVEKALKESHKHVTSNLESAIIPHNRSYKTAKSLRKESNVIWVGNEAYINVGFDINNGGLPSIFLMYGTPKMKPDRNLYNAVYGKKTKKEVMDIQAKIFSEAIRSVMK